MGGTGRYPLRPQNLEDKTLRLDVDPVPKLEMIWRMPGDADIDGEAKRGTQPPGPVLWLNWETPFEDPPPDLSYFPPPPRPKDPTKPVLSFPDPKPMPQELPPALLSDPEWEEPDASLPEWQLPLEPLPMGFMRGVAPLVIMDVSGTMSPTMRGLFLHMKECVAQVLDPDQGELATASAVFDVITFNGGAWAWSSSYNAYQAMLEDTLSGPKTGRPHGGRIASGRGGGRRVREAGSPLQALMPTEAEYLREAQKWVKAWPEARVRNSPALCRPLPPSPAPLSHP